MFNLSAIILSVSAISIDAGMYCANYRAEYGVAQYAHCKKGDLIKVNTDQLINLCDFKSGMQNSGNSRLPFLCIYRGESRKVRLSPKLIRARELRKKKTEEMKKTGRKNL